MSESNRPTGVLSKWAVVVAAVLAAAGGCGSPPPPAAKPADALQAFNQTAGPSVVNVFGELDGAAGGGVVHTVGDAGYRQHTTADEGYDADVSVDPTGRWMVYASTRHNERPGLYLQRTDGTSVTKLTGDEADYAFPTFSPDGRAIAFCSTRSGVWNLYTMDTEGRNVVTVTTGIAQCVHPSFSPDGGRLVYSSLGVRSSQWELWTVDLKTSQRQMIGYGLFPSWSPQKNVDRIAFQQARQRGSRWFSLWTIDLIDGEGRHPTEVAVSSNAAIVSPTWSPDGRRLAFATVLDPAKRPHEKRDPTQTWGEQDIWTVAEDGTDRRRVTDGNGINLAPCWAGDDRIYFVSNRGGTESIWSTRPPTDRGNTGVAKVPTVPGNAVGTSDTRDADR